MVTAPDRCPTCGVDLTEPPTTDDCPIPEDHGRGAISVEVRPDDYMPDRFVACVVTADGIQTTFDCSHLHHTPTAAARCVDKVRAGWDYYHADAEGSDVAIGRTSDGLSVLRECRKTVGRTMTSRRYSYPLAV